jgi:hypothetical protein
VLLSYRVKRVVSDRFGGEWARSAFRKNRITVAEAEQSASQAYIDFLPMLNSGQVDLIQNDRLVAQLTSLERSPRRGAHDAVDHPKGSHDDVANVVALLCTTIGARRHASDLDYSEATDLSRAWWSIARCSRAMALVDASRNFNPRRMKMNRTYSKSRNRGINHNGSGAKDPASTQATGGGGGGRSGGRAR